MKRILTLASLVFATACFGQEACPNVHDINSNGTIDIEDFLSILGLFADVDVDGDGVWDSQDDCLDATACNYLASPTEPCSYLDALGECGGACEGDGDGDGICDDVDDCLGVIDECGVCNGPGPTEVVIEDITILFDSVYLPQLEEWYVYEFGADTTFSYECVPAFTCGDTLNYQGYGYVTVLIGGQCWFAENLRAGQFGNGDAISADLLSTSRCVDLDADGFCDATGPFGCTNLMAVNFNPFAVFDDGSCIVDVVGCTLPYVCNYDPSATIYLPGSCDFSCLGEMPAWSSSSDEGDIEDATVLPVAQDLEGGCLIPCACNYDPLAEYLLIEECDLTCCSSCTDECACNYDETATVDNEVCDYESCDIFEGCLIPTACNYDPCATTSDGSCEFGSCIIMGCTVPVACNYNPDANANDGSCDFLSCQGCTNSCACNYGETNTIEDGSCEYSSCVEDPFLLAAGVSILEGCTNAFACNYDSCATDGSNDGFVCDFFSCIPFGCINPAACNYDPESVINDGTCDFISCFVTGCTLEGACNYDPEAELEDGTCVFGSPGEACAALEEAQGVQYHYTWHAVADDRQMCPAGWHVPSSQEWEELKEALGGAAVAGQQMKSEAGWLNGENGTNSSGFNAEPHGYFDLNGLEGVAKDANFWSSDESNELRASYSYLLWDSEELKTQDLWKDWKLSIRCIQDSE